MLQNLGGAHLLIIVFIVLLLFGAPKLPALARSLGQSARILKKEVSSDSSNETGGGAATADAATSVAADTAASATAPMVMPTQTASKEPDADVQ